MKKPSTKYSDSTLYIDLQAIEDNYLFFRDKAYPAQCGAVVKANAYGLGVEKIAPRLYSIGCRQFFVANLDEAVELRGILPESNIYVFHGVQEGQEEIFHEYNLIPVLNDIYQIELWNIYASKQSENFPAILHIDTGMNRLGLSIKNAEYISENQILTANLDIHFIMSHLACPSQLNHDKNTEQLELFNKVTSLFPDMKYSICNSSGIFLGSDYSFDMIRAGVGLYGVNSTICPNNIESIKNSSNDDIKNVVRLISKIIQIHEIDSKQTVGYGAAYDAPIGSIIATIPVGYADGYLRSIANNDCKSYIYIDGEKVPIIGVISMDLITVDITNISKKVAIATQVELLGDNCSVDMLAFMAGTIGYEILVNLGSRYNIVYLNDN